MRKSYLIEGDLIPFASKLADPSRKRLARSATQGSALALVLVMLSACDLSPDMNLPGIFTPEAYKEAPASAEDTSADAGLPVTYDDTTKWKRVDEKAKIEEVAWWRMFNLPGLDALEEQAMANSPSLEAALQRVLQARGTAEVSGADLWPQVNLGAGPERQKQSSAAINASFPSPTPVTTKPYTLYTAQGSITWELDLFGKNRNTARAAERDADAEANNYRAARLALQADIAQAYIAHASLSAEKEILASTVQARTTTRNQTKSKVDVGLVDDLTLANTETELSTAQADLAAVTQQLAANEHQIAVLVGVNPAQLKLDEVKLTTPPPTVPAGLPSELLTRRPDVQVAVQQMAAANARIGAARAGYFPDISLSALGGFSSGELGDLFKKPNEFWILGPMSGGTILTQPIFQGGRLSGTLAERKAAYAATEANYKQAVLNAFREVEDNLSGLKNLSDQQAATRNAVNAGQRAYTVADQRYKIGYSSQLEFLDAERGLLAAQRGDVQVLGQRYVTTIQLVKALGGTWTAAPAIQSEPVAVPEAKADSVKTDTVTEETAKPIEDNSDVADEKPWWKVW